MSRPRSPAGSNVFRRYPALLLMVAAAVLALALPSALNIPLTEPTSLAEYAPVPGVGQGRDGDLSEIGGLGSLGISPKSVQDSGQSSENSRKPTQFRPQLKRCVGNPPRQAEDPMSPPCVAFFDGDNGGRTYQGVTGDEIVVVVPFSCCGDFVTGQGTERAPATDQFCDIDAPPNTGGSACYNQRGQDHQIIRSVRALARYFNNRYQTYDRHVHFWVYFFSGGGPAAARARAETIFDRKHPFAILRQGGSDFIDAAARKGMMLFFDGGLTQASFYQKYDPLIWSFSPDLEHWERGYVSYVCSKIAPTPVLHAIGGTQNDGQPMEGRPRRYAFMWSDDTSAPAYKIFADMAREDLKKCGINAATEVRFTLRNFGNAETATPSRATQNVAQMRNADVNTILWFGGYEYYTGNAADSVRFYPEIVIAGDKQMDVKGNGQQQSQTWFQNARSTSFVIREDDLRKANGSLACREGDPTLDDSDCVFAQTSFYRSFLIFFKGIQAAGARLSPQRVDRGFHGIPPLSSTDPYQAACFFDPGDFTCVKDTLEQWWDPDAPATYGAFPTPYLGCYRMVGEGRRTLPGNWSSDDEVFKNGSDPCSDFSGSG